MVFWFEIEVVDNYIYLTSKFKQYQNANIRNICKFVYYEKLDWLSQALKQGRFINSPSNSCK